MIGIYEDSFLDYLKKKLGDERVKSNYKNIIVSCPWCEYNKDSNHYHMYISTEVPIFHCFHADCEQSGTVNKLLKKLEGHDISDKFFDKQKVSEIVKNNKIFVKRENEKLIKIPELDIEKFPLKEMYIKQRLKFCNYPSIYIKGLIFDLDKFIELNNIPIDNTLFKLKDYLQSNFIGFLTENQSTVMFRNIDHDQHMKFFKLKLKSTNFLDYYRLPGENPSSNKIVLAEGIFDIFTEYLFDSLDIKNDVRLYASALSSKYLSLIQSIIYHEQIFKPEVIVLSDRGIDSLYYKKIKKYNSHIIDRMSVYFNKGGKDFNTTPVIPSFMSI